MFVNKILKSSALLLLAMGLVLGVGGFGAGLSNDWTLAAAQSEGEKDGPQELSTRGATKPKTDQQQLQGTWEVVSCVQGGENDGSEGEWIFRDRTLLIESNPNPILVQGRLVAFNTAFVANSLRLPKKQKGRSGFKEFFRFRLDLTRTLKRIDLGAWEKDFEDKGEVFEGVYALEGDTLKVCLSKMKENGEMDNRPTVLESKKGSEAILVTLKRKMKAVDKRGRTSSATTTPSAASWPKTEAKREQISSGTMPKAEEELREVKLGQSQKPEDYNTIFDDVLDVVDDYFEVAYANRWEGRIETKPVFERPHTSPRSSGGLRAATTQPVRWRAAVLIAWADDGGYLVDLRIDKEAETKTTKIDEKSPPPPALPAEIEEKKLSPHPEMNWAPVGRDTELEQVILRRLVEQERKRRSEQPRERKEREERAERETSGRGHPKTILLRDFYVDTVDPNRTISVTSLAGPATRIYYLPVSPDAKIKVKDGNAFRNLKVGTRLILELRVENNQMVVTEIRQVGMPPE